MALQIVLVFVAALVLASIAGVRWTRRFGVPAMLVFVGLGVVVGSSGLGVEFSDYALASQIATLALAVILFAGGLETDVREVRPAILPAGLLSTVGVAVKASVVALLMRLTAGWSWTDAFLLGAILAPTDAAAVFQVLKGHGLAPRLKTVLEAESGTNDPVSIYLAGLATAVATGAKLRGADFGWMVLELGLGAAYGVAIAALLRGFLRRTRPSRELTPLALLAGGVGSFGLSELLFGNGYLTAYVTGLALTARRLPWRVSALGVVDSSAWTAQIGLFLLLGLLSFPDKALPLLPTSLLVVAVAIFVARPLAVVVSTVPARLLNPAHGFDLRETVLLSWGGLKGAVPVVLAIGPLLAGHPRGEELFHIVLVVVLVATAIQGMTLVPLARGLGLLDPRHEPPRPTFAVEGAAPIGGSLHELVLADDAPVVGVAIADLVLPQDLVIAAILRRGSLIPARGTTTLEGGDHLVVVSARDDLDAASAAKVFDTRASQK